MCEKLTQCIIITLFLLSSLLFSQENSILKKAGDAFNNNNLTEAKSLYLNALGTNSSNPDIYINLGYIYEVEKDYQTAISYYQKGLPYAGPRTSQLYLNIGLAYYKLGDYETAEKMFTSSIDSVPPAYNAYLNRANTRVKTGGYSGAISDYRTFLSFVPDTKHRSDVEAMVRMLEGEIEDEEARRLAEEARRLEEEEKQRKLLESVLNSLEDASTDTKNLSAGTEDVETPEIELDIVD